MKLSGGQALQLLKDKYPFPLMVQMRERIADGTFAGWDEEAAMHE